ncbi:MAG: energy-coupling factor transporter transmembrane protein EcfT, partial [Bifidobacteriaceae bacterium]|nr:energy-coupling factor transporter transmembrane protein EcfT [Bifidobacteriaceae bacterium]
LASPKRTLAALPGALRQVGTAVVVALTVFPALALGVRRVRRAAELRGPQRHSVLRVIFPVLADALDRSMSLAASLESRGYGATAKPTSPAVSAWRAALACVVLLVAAAGALSLTTGRPGPGWVMVAAALAGGLALGRWLGRDTAVTRLRRERLGPSDWAVIGCAAAAAVGMAAAGPLAGMASLHPGALVWPALPWSAALGLAVAMLPAFGGHAPKVVTQ